MFNSFLFESYERLDKVGVRGPPPRFSIITKCDDRARRYSDEPAEHPLAALPDESPRPSFTTRAQRPAAHLPAAGSPPSQISHGTDSLWWTNYADDRGLALLRSPFAGSLNIHVFVEATILEYHQLADNASRCEDGIDVNLPGHKPNEIVQNALGASIILPGTKLPRLARFQQHQAEGSQSQSLPAKRSKVAKRQGF